MVVNNVFLEAVAAVKGQFPQTGLPEFAFVGRSNVGKSSLINCVISRKSLARTSQNPGKTRTINFYNVEHRLYLVDLPGYGYARVSREEAAKWGRMAEAYLKKREQLRAVVLLLDIRHDPTENDRAMYEWLKYYGKPVIVVATKADKLNRSQLIKHLGVIRRRLDPSESAPLPFSSETGSGRDELWNRLEGMI